MFTKFGKKSVLIILNVGTSRALVYVTGNKATDISLSVDNIFFYAPQLLDHFLLEQVILFFDPPLKILCPHDNYGLEKRERVRGGRMIGKSFHYLKNRKKKEIVLYTLNSLFKKYS